MAMIRMKRMAIDATMPAEGLISSGHDVGQGSAAASGRGPEDHRVVDRAGEHHPGHQPDQARGVTKLRRQHRPDQGAGAGDGREVVPEEDPAGGGIVVRPVVVGMGGRDARIVQHPDARGDERTVVPISNRQYAQDGDDHIKRMHKAR
jgi:hypothetical protein